LMATPEANENTFAREIGHYFDKKYPDMVDTFKAEVKKLTEDGGTNLPEEDFATAVMRVITEPEARKIAPELTSRVVKLGIKLETPKPTVAEVRAARVEARKTEQQLYTENRKAEKAVIDIERRAINEEKMIERLRRESPFSEDTQLREGYDAYKNLVKNSKGAAREAVLSGDAERIKALQLSKEQLATLPSDQNLKLFSETYGKSTKKLSQAEIKALAMKKLEQNADYAKRQERLKMSREEYKKHTEKVQADIENSNAEIIIKAAPKEIFTEAKKVYKRQRAGGATKAEAEKTAVRYIRGKETRVRGLSSAVERKAIVNKLQDSFGDLPEYSRVSVEKQADAANEFIISDRERAIKVAFGEVKPPSGILPESIFIAVENDAIKRGDVALLKELATKSRLISEATEMGQRLRMLAEREPHSPVAAIERLLKRRDEQAELGESGKLKVAQDKTVAQIEKAVKKTAPKKEDWASFIESIKCK